MHRGAQAFILGRLILYIAPVSNVLRFCLEPWPKHKCEMQEGARAPSAPQFIFIVGRWDRVILTLGFLIVHKQRKRWLSFDHFVTPQKD